MILYLRLHLEQMNLFTDDIYMFYSFIDKKHGLLNIEIIHQMLSFKLKKVKANTG